MLRVVQDILIGGKHHFRRAERVTVRSGWKQLGDKAEVVLPFRPEYLHPEGTGQSGAKGIAAGDTIEIKLGYQGNVRTEFKGWVVKVQQKGTQLHLSCEDDFYRLRKVRVKGYRTKTVFDQHVAPLFAQNGFDLVSEGVSKIEFGAWKYDYTLASVCEKLAKVGIYSYFRDGKLYMGLAYSFPEQLGRVAYKSGENVMRWELASRDKETVKVRVKAIGILRTGDNTQRYLEGVAGDPDGEVIKLYYYGVESVSYLNAQAEEELRKYKFDGFEGHIRTWALPFVLHGMTADINDEDRADGSGAYYVDQVVTESTPTSVERNVHLGIKLS